MKSQFTLTLPFVVLFNLFSVSLLFMACEKGACYYSCHDGYENRSVDCNTPTNTAEECAIFAQEECNTTAASNVERVEWAEINDIICQTCSSIACAPQWWTEAKYANYFMPDYSSQLDASCADCSFVDSDFDSSQIRWMSK